jgi:hypothetical protein
MSPPVAQTYALHLTCCLLQKILLVKLKMLQAECFLQNLQYRNYYYTHYPIMYTKYKTCTSSALTNMEAMTRLLLCHPKHSLTKTSSVQDVTSECETYHFKFMVSENNGTRNPSCTHYTNAGGDYFGGIKLNKLHPVCTVFYLIGLRTS